MNLPIKLTTSLFTAAIAVTAPLSSVSAHAHIVQAGIEQPIQNASEISAQQKKAKKPAKKPKKAGQGHLGHH